MAGTLQLCGICNAPVISLAGLGAVLTLCDRFSGSSMAVCANCARRRRKAFRRGAQKLVAFQREQNNAWPIHKIDAALEEGGKSEPNALVGCIDRLIRLRNRTGEVDCVVASLLVGGEATLACAGGEAGEALGRLDLGDEARFSGRFAVNGVFVVESSALVTAAPGAPGRWTDSMQLPSRLFEGEEIVVEGVIGYAGLVPPIGAVAFVYVSPDAGFVRFLSDGDIYVAIADRPATAQALLALKRTDKVRITGRFAPVQDGVPKHKGDILVSSAMLLARGDGVVVQISDEEERALKESEPRRDGL
jgi:hypothetical protein